LSLGQAGKPGNADGQFNQPNDVVTGPDGSIYVSDGHDGQGMTTTAALAEGLKRGATARISKFSPDGKFIKSWGKLGVRHGEFRTPHAMVFDAKGRLWVADRGNHRIEIFDQDGTYLESRYMFGRVSGIFIKNNIVYGNQQNGIINRGSRTSITNNYMSDPQFNNEAVADFRVRSSSLTINAGTDLSSTLAKDMIGTPRPLDGAFDIGAYEYVSGSTSQTAPPQNLRIQSSQ